jgi:O-antigen/teichoic acid export membrane protein
MSQSPDSVSHPFSSLIRTIKEGLATIRLRPFSSETENGRSKERYRLIALGSLSNLIVKLIMSAIGLISVPLTIGYLGKEPYGLWMALTSLVSWIHLSDFGIAKGLINALSESFGKDDRNAAASYIVTAFVALFFLAIIALVPVYLCAQYIPFDRVLNIHDPSLTDTARKSFLVLGIIFLFSVPVNIISDVFRAFQKTYVTNLFQIVAAILSLFGLILALHIKASFIALLCIVSAAPVLGWICAWIYLLFFSRLISLRHANISIAALRRIARSSIPLFLFQIGALLINQVANIVLANIAGLELVADYNILLKIYLLVFFIGSSLAYPFYPAIREASERGDIVWVRRAVSRIIAGRIGVLMTASVPLLVWGNYLVRLWIGKPMQEGFSPLVWSSFCVLLVFSAASSTMSEILTALDHIWSQVLLVFIAAAITLSGMILLIPQCGIAGVFIAITLSTFYPILWTSRKLKRVGCR